MKCLNGQGNAYLPPRLVPKPTQPGELVWASSFFSPSSSGRVKVRASTRTGRRLCPIPVFLDPRSPATGSVPPLGVETPGFQTPWLSYSPAASLGQGSWCRGASVILIYNMGLTSALSGFLEDSEEIGRKLKDFKVLCKFRGRRGRRYKNQIYISIIQIGKLLWTEVQ